jgi:flavin-dependent dehydrogenase
MAEKSKRQKTVIVGAGPVGALAALYAAQRGHEVEIYELRSGAFSKCLSCRQKNGLFRYQFPC